MNEETLPIVGILAGGGLGAIAGAFLASRVGVSPLIAVVVGAGAGTLGGYLLGEHVISPALAAPAPASKPTHTGGGASQFLAQQQNPLAKFANVLGPLLAPTTETTLYYPGT